MDITKLFLILHFSILKMKKINCMDMCSDNRIINKRNILNYPKYLWTLPIKYQIEPELDMNTIKETLYYIGNNTCIKFNETDLSNNNTQGILFQKSSNCASFIGAESQNFSHIIELTVECSKNKGIVLHEIGHALGLIHEHTRNDRDTYVDIDEDNVLANRVHNFKHQTHESYMNYSTTYDYASIMHYGPYGFANNPWKKVLTSKLHKEYDRMMGQKENMTFNDFKKINLVYCDKCNFTKVKTNKKGKGKVKGKGKGKGKVKEENQEKEKQAQNTTNCRNSGYLNYNNCSECICPFGYTGPICRNIVKSDESCGNTTFNATEKVFYHWLSGDKKCYIFIKAENDKKINVGIYYSNAHSKEICTQDVSHQVKFLRDKGTTGLLLCSWRRDIINVTSESDSVLIYYNGQDSNHFLQFGFRQVN